MNKKMLVGVSLIAIVGYLIYKNSKKKSFSGEAKGLTNPNWFSNPDISGVPINIIN
jgi:hypothetical protein